jgi:hypothetical protein
MKIKSFKQLYINKLRDLYSAETQLRDRRLRYGPYLRAAAP